MAETAIYSTEVTWKGDHWGHLVMGNGPQMMFSAPPDAYGHEGVLTPEDAFVAAANTCIMMMFLWACKRFKLDLADYHCRAEGLKRIEIDRTEIFLQVRLWPQISVRQPAGADPAALEKRVRRAVEAAQKYSLIANSLKGEVIVEPTITLLPADDSLTNPEPTP